VSLAAGLADMAVGKFAVFSVIGCAVWCTALASIGYGLSSSWNHIIKAFSYVGYIAAVLVVLAVAVAFWHRLRAVRAERAERDQLGRPGQRGRHVAGGQPVGRSGSGPVPAGGQLPPARRDTGWLDLEQNGSAGATARAGRS